MTKNALITGVTGQDGAYLAELLLKKGCAVHGIKRSLSVFDTDRVGHLHHTPHVVYQEFTLQYGEPTDDPDLSRIVGPAQPLSNYFAEGAPTFRLAHHDRFAGLNNLSACFRNKSLFDEKLPQGFIRVIQVF